MKTIFDKVSTNHLHAKNRIVRSATWEALSNIDGSPSDKQLKIYEELAAGEVGTIVTGFTTVSDNDRYIDGMSRLSNDKIIPEWNKLTDIVHKQKCNIIIQLALGEYITSDGRRIFANNCNKNDLMNLVNMFWKAAKRAVDAGFDGIQIHCAHNFWLSKFLSPAYNKRTDEYGGNQENRTRLIAEIYHEIRKNAPGLHITMKMNCSDFFEGGLTMDDAMITCLIMADEGIDSIEVSGNGTSVAGIKAGINEAYFLEFAQKLKQRCSVPVILVGGLRSIEIMNSVLNETDIEMLSISRPLIREPELLKRWRLVDKTPAKCISCNKCYETEGHRCIFKGIS